MIVFGRFSQLWRYYLLCWCIYVCFFLTLMDVKLVFDCLTIPRWSCVCLQACQTLSLPAKWTDEKHNPYLNSMESSFVNQLYNNENASSDLLGFLPLGTPKPMKLGSTSNFCHFSCQVLKPDIFFFIQNLWGRDFTFWFSIHNPSCWSCVVWMSRYNVT